MSNSDIDKLLDDLIENFPTKKSKLLSVEKDEIVWGYFKFTYICLQCNRKFHGELFHPNFDIPKKRFISWCPECLDKEVFWLHQSFKVERIELPEDS